MSSMSHREYCARIAWLEQRRDKPTTDQYYLMQIAQEVRRVLAKNKNSIKLEHFDLFPKGKGREPVKQQSWQESKSIWARSLTAILGKRNDG